MNPHAFSPKPLLIAAVALLALLGGLALSGAGARAAAKPVSHECQHPLVTGEEAVNVKGVSVPEACKVVRALGDFLSKPANIRKLYECRGPSNRPGRPVLLMDEFQGWKLKLVDTYGFLMYKKGASFRVTGTDFPVNCS
jgi:hypothetical protein